MHWPAMRAARWLWGNLGKRPDMTVADSPYIFKFDVPVSEIGNEDTAIAVLSALEPEFFIKARRLKAKTKLSEKDRKFLKDYGAFIAAESARIFVFDVVYDRIKRKRLWNGDFSHFAQALNNDGFFFEREVCDYLKSNGCECRYAEKSLVAQYYRTALDRKLWTLDEAVSLFTGTELDGCEFTDLRKETAIVRKLDPAWQNLNENRSEKRNPEWCYEDRNTGKYESLRDWLTRHTAAGGISAKETSGVLFYRPLAIVEWLRDLTGQEPVPVLTALLSPQKGCIENKVHASRADHKRIFDDLQKEYRLTGKPLGRDEEAEEMRQRLSPKGFNAAWQREFRAGLNIRRGRRPTGKSDKRKSAI
jgi:hypothetical protein